MQGGNGVKGRAWFVQQENLRFYRQAASDTEPLALFVGKVEGVFVQPVLHLIPQPDRLQTALHYFGELVVSGNTLEAGSVGDIVKDGAGEREGWRRSTLPGAGGYQYPSPGHLYHPRGYCRYG